MLHVAHKKILETFKIERLKDLQQKTIEKQVRGQDVFVIQPTGPENR